MQRSSNRRQLC